MPLRTVSGGVRCAAVLLAAVATFALLPGCTSWTMVVEEQYGLYLKALTARHDQPLARTLTWKHQYTAGTGWSQQTWFIVDGRLVRNAKELVDVKMLTIQPSTSGWKTSDLYAQQAREYSQKGQHEMAVAYQSASTVSAQTQIASERMAAGMAVAGAIQGLGSALLDATVLVSTSGAVKHVKDEGFGVISNRAPEGTVLELFFRSQRSDGGDAKPAQILMQWETVATLKDADGRIWRSAAAFKNYMMVHFGSEPMPAPAELAHGGYFRIDPATGLPIEGSARYEAESNEMKKILSGGGNVEFGITAVRAIQDIYEQMDAASASRRE